MVATYTIALCDIANAQRPPIGSVEPFKHELSAYYSCNAKIASVVWQQPGDPMSLAVAARGTCQSEEAALALAMRRGRSVRFAEEMIKEARRVVVERNAASIVKYRARKAWQDTR
jgi:hypothetical protein